MMRSTIFFLGSKCAKKYWYSSFGRENIRQTFAFVREEDACSDAKIPLSHSFTYMYV